MTNPSLSYLGPAKLTAKLEIISGLHIGAGKDAIEIGGIDQPVVKLPSGEPYVPGSSLKGKLRFLLEWAFGKIDPNGAPWKGGETENLIMDPILRIFGTSSNQESHSLGPTRLLMRDAFLRKENKDKAWTEEKIEVTMDRMAGKAADPGPRTIERVPPGISFDFEAIFRLYDVDQDNGKRDLECMGWLIQGLVLLEQDALGGSGSRGYGQIKFSNLKIQNLHSNKYKELNLDIFRGHEFNKSSPPEKIMHEINGIFQFPIQKSE